jgi:hypothetical protein
MKTMTDSQMWRLLWGLQLLILGTIFVIGSNAHGGEVGLQWDPVTGATGYRVGYGTASGTYTSTIDVGAPSAATITGLADCTTHYLAVKGTNAAGASPFWSNEVAGWPRPYVIGVEPSQVVAGEVTTLTLTGGNYQPGLSVTASDPDVTISQTNVLACGSMTLVLSTPATMAPGFVDLEIINPDQVYGTLQFEVTTVLIPVISTLSRSDQHEVEPPPPEPPIVDEIILDDQDELATEYSGPWNVTGPARWNRPCVYGDGNPERPECLAHQTDPGAEGAWFSWSTPIADGTYTVTIYTGGNDRRDPANRWEVWDGDSMRASLLCTQTEEPTCTSSNGTTSGAIVGTYVFVNGTATVKVIGSAGGEGTIADEVRLTRAP